MKMIALFLVLISLVACLVYSATTVSVVNPYTGKLDLVGPGPGLTPGNTYYLYQSSTTNSYYTFNGESLCLFVNSVSKVCYTQALASSFLLLEDGSSYLLQEDGSSKVILE